MAKRSLNFRVPDGLDPTQLAEELRKASVAQLTHIEIYPTKIVMKIFGDLVSVERSVESVKSAYTEALKRHRYVGKEKITVPKRNIASVLGFPISLDMLVDALRLKGIPFDETDEYIVIRGEHRHISEMVKRIFESYLASKESFIGAARRVASVMSVVLDADVISIGEKGVRLGAFTKKSDKYCLAVNPQMAYSILIKEKSEDVGK